MKLYLFIETAYSDNTVIKCEVLLKKQNKPIGSNLLTIVRVDLVAISFSYTSDIYRELIELIGYVVLGSSGLNIFDR